MSFVGFMAAKSLFISCFLLPYQRPALHYSRVLYPTSTSPASPNHPFRPDRLRLHHGPALCRRLRRPPDLLRPLPSLLPFPSSSPSQLRALPFPPTFRRTTGRPSTSPSGGPRRTPGPPISTARRCRSVSCGWSTLCKEVHHAGDDPDERRTLRPPGRHT